MINPQSIPNPNKLTNIPRERRNRQADPMADFVPIDQFAEKHKDKLKPSQVRWLARSRTENGLAEIGAVVLVSRRLFISESKFAEWFAKQTS